MRTRLTFFTAFIFLFSLFVNSPAQNSENFKKFELDDIGKLSTLTDPQISPDGKSILIVVSKPDFVENKNKNDIYLIDISTGNSKRITFNRSNVSHPRWSPSGDRIAFIANDTKQNISTNQIFIISVGGGEAMKLSDSTTGVQQFSWSPDGNSIAFVQEDEPENKKEIDKGYDAFEIKYNSMFLNKKPMSSHIWLIPSTGGVASRLTSGDWSLPMSYPPGTPSSPISWSPDGRKIAFQCNETPYSGELICTIRLIDTATRKVEALTSRKKEDLSVNLESFPSFSPDGKYISYWFPRDNLISGFEVFVTSIGQGNGRCLTYKLDRWIYRSEWFKDGRSILVAANDNKTVSLWVQSIDGDSKKINLGDLCVTGTFWYNCNVGPNGSIAIIASASNSPQELYYLSSINANPVKLTDFNSEVASMKFGKQETVSWKSDSFLVNGIITVPPDFDAKKKYPLVLRIHGGPQAASKEEFNPDAQYTASHGYVVFEPNYRGSDNMGLTFCTAINGDAGIGPGKDVMRGIAKLKSQSYIDSTKIAVSGWSWGGFMTTWLIGNYKGWKCAVAGAAVTDLIDEYTLSDNGTMLRYEQGNGSYPFSNKSIINNWIKQSPITYAENVETPTLILSCTADERVPIPQSYKFFRILKENGIEAKFVVFPVGGHHPSDPVRNKETYRLWLEWIDQHMK